MRKCPEALSPQRSVISKDDAARDQRVGPDWTGLVWILGKHGTRLGDCQGWTPKSWSMVGVYASMVHICGCNFDVVMHMFDGITVCPCSRWPVAAGFLSSLKIGQPMPVSSMKSKPEPPQSHCHNSILLASGNHHLSLLRLLFWRFYSSFP